MAARDITAIILSFNEEIHIGRCIERIRDHVGRIVVVDSGSNDRTAEIAHSLGAEVLANRFVNQAQQFNWALSQLNIESGWILRLDCDEYLDAAALAWIDRLELLPDHIAGVEFRLKLIFKGKFIRWGGYYSTDLARLWRAGKGRVEARWMDERTVVDGRVTRAPGNLVDENLNSIGWWTDKHNRYASRHVLEMTMVRHFADRYQDKDVRLLSRKAQMKRFLRNRVYLNFPLLVRPLLYWSYRYFVMLGFLDGKMGLVWHFLHGYWYYMLIDAKLVEADRILARQGEAALIEHFRVSHGITLQRIGDRE
jgi:glycosyltransferase involved in cell wall biosynthesis